MSAAPSSTRSRPPVVLDLDGSVGRLPGELRFDLRDWQEAVRFGCTLRTFGTFRDVLDKKLPTAAGHGTVFFGSGDFHHLSWPLVERCIEQLAFTAMRPVRLVVLDNHPDNMRFPLGVHCGSWVRRVALLPAVSHVHVAGITSADIGNGHAWENYLAPLQAGKLSYWHVGVDTRWSRWLGVQHAFKAFDDTAQLTQALARQLRSEPAPTYLSIDKDVFANDVVQTNWDQGRMTEAEAHTVIAALAGHIVGSDVTGDVSSHRYATAWKRWMSAGDGQDTQVDAASLAAWQAGQHAFNARLLSAIAAPAG